MELKLEILSTVSIKRKKPWPRLAWLLEREPPFSLYLLDGSRISQVSLRTGKTRKKFPSLLQLQSHIALTSTSPDGAYLGGLTINGDFFLWNKATEVLETFVSPLSRLGGEKDKPSVQQFKDHSLFISESGEQALLVANKNEIYLWELKEKGRTFWWKVIPPSNVEMPEASGREAVVDACFYVHPVLGECCSCVFVFTSRESHHHVTTITHLLINWPNLAVQFYSNHTHQPETAQHAFPFGAHSYQGQIGPGSPPHFVTQQENLSTSNVSTKDTVLQTEESKGQSSSDNDGHRSNNGYAPPISDRTNVLPLKDRTNLGEHSNGHFLAKPSRKQTHFSALLDSPPPFQASWSTLSHSPASGNRVSSSTHTGRGSYVCKISPSGSVVALCVNEREACDTHMMFFSPLVNIGVMNPVYPLRENSSCRGRTYWVTDMTWTHDELFLVCVTRRGCLLILPRFGPPLKLVTVGASSLEMRPTTFLPLHPLITVTGVSKAITDHETSQSSERDLLRQRFSVSPHPRLPIFLCSDGYSLTILKFTSDTTSSSLSHLVNGLVLNARENLGLPFIDLPVTAESSKEDGIIIKGDLAATLGGSDLGSTLASTLSSDVGGGGFLSGLSGLEAGVIHFAGVDSDLECTKSSFGSQTVLKKQTVLSAVAQIQAAFGLLLSSSVTDPIMLNTEQTVTENLPSGSGSNPTFKKTTDLLANTISTIISRLNLSLGCDLILQDGSQFAPLLQGMIDTLFGLISLDSINQCHQDVVVTIVNGILKAMLVKSLTKHNEFVAIKNQQHTIQSLQEYTKVIAEEVSSISDLLDELVSILARTYSLQHISTKDLPSLYAPSLSAQDLHHKQSLPDDLALQLTPSLLALLEVVTSFWKDLKSCGELSKNVLSGERGHPSRIQLREIGLLCKSLESGMHSALAALQYAHAQICGLLRLEYAGIAKYSQEYLVQESSTTSHVDGSNSTLVERPNGNPITFVSKDASSHRHSEISVLFTYLEKYDLDSALKYAHSFISTQDTNTGITRTPHTTDHKSASEKRHRSNTAHHRSHSVVPTPRNTTTTGASILSRSKSWTAHSSSGNALSFTRETNFIVNEQGRVIVAYLAQLTMAYFTNKKLLVSSSLSCCNQPSKVERYLELSQSKLASAIREQNLSEIWTVDHTLELLLLTDMWAQACDFVVELGDWRKGVLLATAYLCHSRHLCNEKRDIPVEDKLRTRVTELAMKDIFKLLSLQSELILSRGTSLEISQSLSSTLMMCSLSHLDSVLMSVAVTLLKRLRVCCKSLSLEVPSYVYLPAPPLYCPQPSVTREELIQSPEEYNLRIKISNLVHNLILTLQSSNSLHPCARWYITKLQQQIVTSTADATELLRLPGSRSEMTQPALVVPPSAVKFDDDPSKLSPALQTLLALFRELCGLMWFFHVRDQASLYLRKLQPKIHKPQTPPEEVHQAARWCARLLSFTEFLSHDGGVTYSHCVQDVVLSTLMELPADRFLAELLAYCFPESVFDARYLEAKMKRLLSRLRSSPDPHQASSSSDRHFPLSIHYQTRSQQLLSQRGDTFDQNCGSFISLVKFSIDMTATDVQMEALKVGSFSFEWDTEYCNFLDTFLAVILPGEVTPIRLPFSNTSVIDSPHLSSMLPFLSEFTNNETDREMKVTENQSPSWQEILSLLDVFTRWSQTSTPQLVQQELTKRNKNDRRKKGATTTPAAPVMRVNVSTSFIVNCLKQREEKMKKGDNRKVETLKQDQKTLDPSRHITANPSMVSVPQPPPLEATLPTRSESVSPTDEESRSLHMEDLNQSPRSQMPLNVKTHGDEVDLALQANRHEEPLILLGVPEGVLKGHLPPEVGRSLLASSKTASDHAARRAMFSHSPDDDDNSALDVVLTESFSSSTGEAPSAVTFSIGEIVKQTKPGDATMAFELDTLSSISDQLPHISQHTNHHQHSTVEGGIGQTNQKKATERTNGQKEKKKGNSNKDQQVSSVNQREGEGGSDQCNGGLGDMGNGNGDSESDHSGSKSESETEHEEEDDSSTVVVTSSTLSEISQVLTEEGGSHNTTIQAEETENKQTDEVNAVRESLKVITAAKSSNQKTVEEQSDETAQAESKDSIRDIVRTEMTKVLQYQHEQLLSILTEQSVGHQQRVPTNTHKTQPLAVNDLEASPEIPANTQPSMQSSTSERSEDIAPVLKLEELVSPTDTAITGQLSHFTVSVSPVRPQRTIHQVQQPQLLHQQDMQQAFTQRFNPAGSTAPRKLNTGPSSQTKSCSQADNLTLLHIDDLCEPGASGAEQRAKKPSSLENEFPGLVQALNAFNKSVTPVTLNFGPQISAQNERVVSVDRKGMPLLKLPLKEEDTLPGMVRPTLHQELPAQQMPVVMSAMPLLTLPPEMLANQPPSSHRPHTYHTLPSHPHTSHSHHPPSHTHKPPQPLENIKLPQISIQPFIPKLIPPDVIWPKTTGTDQNLPKQVDSPLLLKLDDPLTKMKENGLKLLQLPKEFQIQETVPQLLHVNSAERRQYRRHPLGPRSAGRSRRNEPTFDSTTSSFEISSDSYSRPVVEDDNKVVRVGMKGKAKKKTKHSRHVTWKRESSVEPPEQVATGKVRSPMPGSKMLSETARSPQHSTSISTLEESETSRTVYDHQSSQNESFEAERATLVDHHASSPENIETSETLHKPVGTAIIQPLSGLVHPDNVPYKSLEQRRLEMNSPSFSPPKSRDPNNVSSDNATPSESHHTVTLSQDQEDTCNLKKVSRKVDVEPMTSNTEDTEKVTNIRTTSADVGVQVDTPMSAESAVLNSPITSGLRVDEGTQVERPHKPLVMRDTGSDGDSVSGRGIDDVCRTGMESEHVSESGSISSKSNPSLPIHSPCMTPSKVEGNTVPYPLESESDSSIGPVPIPKDYVGFSSTPPPPLYFSAVDEESVATTTDNHKERESVLVKVDVFEKLQLLEEQLNAIESTARTVEGEFKTTNQILQTIDQLQTVSETLATSGNVHEDSSVHPTPSEDVDHYVSTSTPRDLTHNNVNTRLIPFDSQLIPVNTGLRPLDPVNTQLRQADTQSIRFDQDTPTCDINEMQPFQDGHYSSNLNNTNKATNTSVSNGPTNEHAPLTSRKKTEQLPRKFEARETLPHSSNDIKTWQVTTRAGTTTSKRGTGKTKPGKQQHVSFNEQQQQVRTRNGDHQLVGKKGVHNKPSKADRDKIREWMIAKRQERLAEFVSKRKGLQEKEKRPFEPPPSPKSKCSSKDHVKSVKRDQEKEFVAKRIDEAYSLMNDLLSSKPLSKRSTSPSHSSLRPSTSSESLPLSQIESKTNRLQKTTSTADKCKVDVHVSSAHLPPRGTGYGAKSRRLKATQDTKRCARDHSHGLDSMLKKSSSDSNLFRHSVGDVMGSSSAGGNYSSTTGLSGTYTKALTSPKRENRLRKISSVEGLTEDEQDRIATILASIDYDAGSMSSGSVYSNIDWEEVDRLLDN